MIWFCCIIFFCCCGLGENATLKSLSLADFKACVTSCIAAVWLPWHCALNRKKPFLHFENTWKEGNFRRGWIYNFILTWLILHREVFVQEAACLIMAQLCLDWEQTWCQRLPVGTAPTRHTNGSCGCGVMSSSPRFHDAKPTTDWATAGVGLSV